MDVRLPDGTVIQNVPDGTSKKDLTDSLARNGYDVRKLGLDPSQPFQIGKAGLAQAARDVAETPSDSFLGDVGRRLATGIGAGANKLASAVLPWTDDKDTRQVAQEMVNAIPGAGAAEMATEIAMTAGPVAKAMRGLAPYTPTFFKQALASTGLGAAAGAVTTPGDISTQEGLDERLQGAAFGGLGGLGGEVGGRVLKKALAGMITPSQSAKDLMAKGIQPTVGQGAESGGWKALEEASSGIPGVGRIVKGGQERAVGDFQEKLLGIASDTDSARKVIDALSAGERRTWNRVVPNFDKLSVREQVREVAKHLGRQYDFVLADVKPIPVSSLNVPLRGLRDEARAEVEAVISRNLTNREVVTGQQYKDFLGELRTVADDFLSSDRAVDKRSGRAIVELRETLLEKMPENVREVDKLWSNFLRFQESSHATLRPEAGVTPAKLQEAVRREAHGNTFARGTAPMQDLSDPAQILRVSGESLPRTLSGLGLGALPLVTHPVAAIPAIAGVLGATKPGAALAFGNTDIQRAIKAALESPEVRALLTSSGVSLADALRERPQGEKVFE
jgi:hypothetical protein